MGCFRFLRFKLRGKRVVERVAAIDIANDVEDTASAACDQIISSNKGVRKFSWEDIQKSTMDFSLVIGYGGFSTVYLAQFPGGGYCKSSVAAAVKIQCSSERLNEAHRQELEILLHLRHPNIVKLLGHCDDREEGILVFEYVPNGTLQEKLHGSKTTQHLPWKRRVVIAFQLAQAIEYLHDRCSLPIIHGDIKASNILLDKQMNCKLCDFGSAKLGFSSMVLPPSRRNRIMMMGSPGYTDPLYLRTGFASKKNDVYSFGVILLELITGIQALDPLTGERLTKRVEPLLWGDVGKVVEMVDPRLRGDFDVDEARDMAAIAATCICDSPSHRPSMSDILITMRNEIAFVS